MGRNHLVGRHGDAANAVLAAVGHNFRLLVAQVAALLTGAPAKSTAHQTG